MSTDHGLRCPEHDTATSFYAAQGALGLKSLLAMWEARDALAVLRRRSVNPAILKEPEFFSVQGAGEVVEFLAGHGGCLLEVVDEYGGRRLLPDVVDEHHEPDADEIVRRVLELLGFPADSIERTHRAIVDALWEQRVISFHRRPERLS